MAGESLLFALGTGLLWAVHLVFMGRAILRPHREPASRVAWVVVMVALPVVGILAYLLLGETNIGNARVEKALKAREKQPDLKGTPGAAEPCYKPGADTRYPHLFQMGHSVNGFPPVGGNQGWLFTDSNASIDSVVADIDAAKDHVHLVFYIWLRDNNGLKVAEALMRAARRGVTCRVMADALGSRKMIRSKHWRAMREAGVRTATALPIGNPLLRMLRGRIDLRNHRKIVVIDNFVTYCGSQNCADPEFRIKARFAPWVDVLMRFEGPVARQNQSLFAGDWMSMVDEDITPLLRQPLPPGQPGVTAQVIGTGPTMRQSAMPEVFANLMFAARRELFITTPYYVPDEAMQAALCACARRGVATTVVFPARNDSWVVGAASRSYYPELLEAGVRIYEYEGGLLHAKTLTLDGEITLIGSANMDRRSFELNFENNVLFHDPSLTSEVRRCQQAYLGRSHQVTAAQVEQWSTAQRLWGNTIAMLGPVL
ncbi:cardiolipin synthase [Fundidesulfovibrio agrisoli]|uniref:cardiolipin synthase n=1 Tax=Fundidesulfovibrio agrisoli TaxID=2922717 RepID=UPI001FAD47E2|nr:cardiolipin synthase [Fundidesulfovibrio agrisoli]